MTRAGWYAQHNGGGWRKARKPFVCGQSLCVHRVQIGEQYLDTRQLAGQWPNFKKICAECANEPIKENYVAHS